MLDRRGKRSQTLPMRDAIDDVQQRAGEALAQDALGERQTATPVILSR